jgi:hypothetical protein
MAMAEPPKPQALFNYRKIGGVIELRFKDDREVRTSLAKEFIGFENPIEGRFEGQATFDELKANPSFSAFVEGEGKGLETELYIRAEKGRVPRRSILVICAPGKVRASCSWEAESGITFEAFSV